MFQKRFRRTDSAESNNSSLASFFLSRNNSKTRQQQGPSPVAPPGVGANGGHSVIERSASGGVCTVREPNHSMNSYIRSMMCSVSEYVKIRILAKQWQI